MPQVPNLAAWDRGNRGSADVHMMSGAASAVPAAPAAVANLAAGRRAPPEQTLFLPPQTPAQAYVRNVAEFDSMKYIHPSAATKHPIFGAMYDCMKIPLFDKLAEVATVRALQLQGAYALA